MAEVFRLADYAQTAGTIVDLRGGTLKLEAESWGTRTAPMEGEYRYSQFGAQPRFDHLGVMVENFNLIGDDTVANLITGHNKIMAVIEKARLFHADSMRSESWWLEANANGEDAKRTLLYEGSLQSLTGVGMSALLEKKKLRVGCSLSRHPLWESVAATTEAAEAAVSLFGGKWTPSTIPAGTSPGRIHKTILDTGADAAITTRLWAGIRPTYAGVTGFDPVIELEAGTAGTDTAVATDATASPGGGGNTKMLCTFATTTTNAKRVSIPLVTHDATHLAQYTGRYLVLLRCKMTAGTAAVRLATGMTINAGELPPLVQGDAVYVTNTGWQLVPLGEVAIPPYAYRTGYAGDLRNMLFQIWAESIAAGDLHLDALCLIPSDHFLYGDGVYTGQSLASLAGYVWETDETLMQTLLLSGGTYYASGVTDFALRDWYWPVEGGTLIVAGQQGATHSLTKTITPTLTVFPRWYNFRG